MNLNEVKLEHSGFNSQLLQEKLEPPKSLLLENKTFTALKPSCLNNNPIIGYIKKIFQKIYHLFIPYMPTDVIGVASAFNRSIFTQKGTFERLPLPNLISYFDRFLEGDEAYTPEFKKCLNQFKNTLEFQTQNDSSLRFKKNQLGGEHASKIAKEIKDLKNGEYRLVCANRRANDPLFYLFSKNENGLTFKIIGRGETMVSLSGVQEVAILGKAKITNVITFDHLPPEEISEPWIKALLYNTEIVDVFDKENLIKLTAHIHKYRKEITTLETLGQKTNDVFKSIVTVLKEVNTLSKASSNENAALGSRLYLRLELSALFQLYNEHKEQPYPQSQAIESLKTMLRTVSAKTLSYYNKGYIQKADLEEIYAELSIIYQALSTTSQKEEIPSLESLKTIKMQTYTSGNVPLSSLGIQPPTEIPPLESPIGQPVVPQASLKMPLPELSPTRRQELFLSSDDKIDTIEEFQARIAHLSEHPSLNSIIETIFSVDFFPYQRNDSFAIFGLSSNNFDPVDSFWWEITEEDAITLMTQLNTLSRFLADELKQKDFVSLNAFDALIKMSMMVYFLNARFFKTRKYETFNTNLSDILNKFYNIQKGFDLFGKIEYEVFERSGHSLNQSNLKLRKELLACNCAIKAEEDDSISREQASQNFVYTIAQEDILKELLNSKISKYLTPHAMQSWMRPLKHPFLLAAYRNMSIRIGKHTPSGGVGFFGSIGLSKEEIEEKKAEHTQHLWHKDGLKTQEAIVDDPEVTANFLIDDLNQMVEYFNRYDHHKDSPYTPSKVDFTKEEMIAILLLLRKNAPQTELIGFLERFPSLLNEPEICNFLDLLLFHESLAETLNDYELFRNDLPLFFGQKIAEYKEKAAKDSRFLNALLFFVESSEKLKSIYHQLGYPTDAFCSECQALIQDLVMQANQDIQLQPYTHQLLTLNLKFTFEQNSLSQNDVQRAILQYNLLKNTPFDPLKLDPQTQLLIESKYQDLCERLDTSSLNQEDYTWILNLLLDSKSLFAGQTAWKGAFPIFSNDQYQIDLRVGNITILQSNLSLTPLPSEILEETLFQETFRDVDHLLCFLKQNETGLKTYFFTDHQGTQCRVEEENGTYRYYKQFAALQNKELQAIAFSKLQPVNENKSKTPKLPFIFDEGLFIDPQEPTKGFCFDANHKLLFKVELSHSGTLLGITDCKDVEETGPWEVMCAKDLSTSLLSRLSKFEDLSQILVWKAKDGPKKIELPRYGLTFALEQNTLACLNSQYKGYYVDLEASLEERKGFPFSLLLKHSDRELPQKLILPETSSIALELHTEEPQLTGMAWLLKKVTLHVQEKLSQLNHQSKIKQILSPLLDYFGQKFNSRFIQHQIQTTQKSLSHFSVDLRPYTQELLIGKKDHLHTSIELIKQAITVGHYSLAAEVMQSMKLEKKDLAPNDFSYITKFLKQRLSDHPNEAALKLQLIQRIKTIIKKDAHYQNLKKRLHDLSIPLAKTYFSHRQNLSSFLLLQPTELVQLAKLIKKLDNDYYQNHLSPYFLNEDETFQLPVRFVSENSSTSDKAKTKSKFKLDYDDYKKINDAHCNREQIYELETFHPFFPKISQCTTYFLPLYKSLLENDPKSEAFQTIKWSLALYASTEASTEDLSVYLYHLLDSLIKIREAGGSLDSLPKPPAIEKNKEDSFKSFTSEIKEFMKKLVPALQPFQEQFFQEAVNAPQKDFQASNPIPDTHFDIEVAKLKAASRERTRVIENLEENIQPGIPSELETFKSSFEYHANGTPLLFKEEELTPFFQTKEVCLPNLTLPSIPIHASSAEKEAVKRLQEDLYTFKENEEKASHHVLHRSKETLKNLQQLVTSQRDQKLLQKEEAKKAIDDLILSSLNAEEQIAIYAGTKQLPSYTDLMLGLLQNRFEEMQNQGVLSKNLDLQMLKKRLLNYFELEICLHLAEVSKNKIQHLTDELETLSQEEWESESNLLFQLITRQHHYSSNEAPALLLFELFNFMTFRKINSTSNQLELLFNLLNEPTGVTLAATGVGKTKVLSVLRAFMKANGKNLVTLKVLPTLFNQTLQDMQTLLGDTFKRSIYPIRFDLKTRLVKWKKIRVKQPDGSRQIENVQESIFKEMYQSMLETIQQRGCVISDYKSFPLLEEKFWKLSLELSAMATEGISPPDIEMEHWTYLKKILILLQNKEDGSMDELDRPNRPIHRIQIQVEKAKKPAEFLIDHSLLIYDLLLEEKDLLLRENLQGELLEKTRLKIIENVATKLAETMKTENVTVQELVSYFTGKNEDVLSKIASWEPRDKDILAFYKDQCHLFLPLTLGYAHKSRYARSDDGKRTVPCALGEKTTAKFGKIQEEINYTIQNYIQAGVSETDVKVWLAQLQKDLDHQYTGAEGRFHMIFPDKNIQDLASYSIADLISEINQDQQKIRYFLKLHLDQIVVSGSVISMDPQNSLDMSRVVSGISATRGGIDESHPKFTINHESIGHIQAEMTYRLVQRLERGELLEYNPQHPLELLNQVENLDAIIDGSGAFKELSSKETAEAFLKANPQLKRVGFHNEKGKLDFVGEATATIDERGFYFSQAHTRGADISLKRNALGLITVNNTGTFEELNQQEGRLRLKGQKTRLAFSTFTPHLNKVENVIAEKTMYGARVAAHDFYQQTSQHLRNLVRSEAKKVLLQETDFNTYLAKFRELKNLIISPPSPTYEEAGSYFEENKRIQLNNKDPKDTLESLKRALIQQSKGYELNSIISSIEGFEISEELLKKMPEHVYEAQSIMETGLEIELEEELEVENEMENEFEYELENEEELETIHQLSSDVPFYLPRTLDAIMVYSVDNIHSAYNRKIRHTEAFLPLSRRDPLYQRKPFDNKMYRVGPVFVELDKGRWANQATIKNIIIGDLLDDTSDIRTGFRPKSGFYYDIRTGRALKVLNQEKFFQIRGLEYVEMDSTDVENCMNSEEFKEIIAQIKFFDGQIEGYHPEELKYLAKWISENTPQAMRHHFVHEVIRLRPEVVQSYPYSQIWKLFNQLIG